MASLLEEKDAIRELMAEYCFRYDGAEFDLWIDLFTEDGVFDLGKRVVRGRAELTAFAKATPLVDGKPPMKHCVMNEVISVDGVTATAKCYLVLVRKGKDGPLVTGIAGRYVDKLVKQNGRWLFAERKVHFDLAA